MKPEIVASPKPDPADHAAILEPLVAFNTASAGPSGLENIAVLLRDGNPRATVGGIWGKISYDWLFVDVIFVPTELRGQGFGAELMRHAELIARNRDCVGVWLDTHSFQAPGFYETLGYEAFGELPDHPRGSKRTFFRKLL